MAKIDLAKKAKLAAEIIGDDTMPTISDRELEFVSGMVQGLSAIKAFERAFPEFYEEGMKQSAKYWRIAHIKSKPEVKAWENKMKEAQLAHFLGTAEQYAAECRAMMVKAEKADNLNAAVRALELVGKAEGHFERNVISLEKKEDGDLIQRIELSMGPKMAEAAKKRLGIA
jgi:hypothetical protein